MGYQITHKTRPVRDAEHFLSYAKSKGFEAKTVIDVGVGYGTWPLYNAFPNANFILVEPLEEYDGVVKDIQSKVNAVWHKWAAGADDGTLEIHLPKKDLEKTSFHQRTAVTDLGGEVESRTIPVKTLDSIVDVQSPLLLKIDTEGHEIQALKGASKLLGLAEIVMLEVSVGARFEGGYRMIELTKIMDEAGFDLIDITQISQSSGGPMKMLDGVFARRGSVLGLPKP